MFLHGKRAKAAMLAGIPLLALPLLADAGSSRDRSHRGDSQGSFSQSAFSQEDIVQGEIARKEGDQITLRTRDGERITFRINSETRQFCPEEGLSSQTSQSAQRTGLRSDSSSQGSGQSTQSLSGMGSSSGMSTSSGTGSSSGSSMSGQSSPMTSGSQSGTQQEQQKAGLIFGDCQFEEGDMIKVKLDQSGNASFVRSWGSDSENFFRAGRSGEQYFVLPAGQLGGLDITDKEAGHTVKSSDGEKIGKIQRIMTNSRGDVSYVIIKKEDGQLISLPWQAVEGAGDNTFKVNVSKNQLGNLPVLQEDESPTQHVQRNWDLSEDGQFASSDRFGRDRQARYQDTRSQGDGEDFFRERYGARQSDQDFRGPRRGARGDRYDYERNQDQSFSDREYPQKGARPGVAGERGRVSIFGSPATLPPGRHAPQYEGADRGRSFDRERQGRYSDDYRDRRDRQRQYSDRERPDWYSQGYQSRMDRERRYMDPITAPRYDRGGYDRDRRQSRSFDRSRQGRFSDRGQQDRFFSDSSRGEGEGSTFDRYQSRRRSGSGDRDYRPDPYRP
jgi:hypothetical protein